MTPYNFSLFFIDFVYFNFVDILAKHFISCIDEKTINFQITQIPFLWIPSNYDIVYKKWRVNIFHCFPSILSVKMDKNV